jgi:hypothetical protein
VGPGVLLRVNQVVELQGPNLRSWQIDRSEVGRVLTSHLHCIRWHTSFSYLME